MADAWDIKVRAFEMRSSYVGVYGTSEEIKSARNYSEIITAYKYKLSEYNESVANGKTDVKPPKKPDNYEENARRYFDIKERMENKKMEGLFHLMIHGAIQQQVIHQKV